MVWPSPRRPGPLLLAGAALLLACAPSGASAAPDDDVPADAPAPDAPADASDDAPADVAGEALETVDIDALRLAGRRATGRGFGMLGASLGVSIAVGLPVAWGFLADDLPVASGGSYLGLAFAPPTLGLAVGNFVQAALIAAVVHEPGRFPLAARQGRAGRGYWRTTSLVFAGVATAGIAVAFLPPIVKASVDHPPPAVLGAAFAGGFATSLGLSAVGIAVGVLEGGRLLERGAEPVAWAVTPWFDPIGGGGGASAVVVF